MVEKEYIEREAALKIIDNYSKTVESDGKEIVKAVRDIVDFICPTADVQEVVRCKECKKFCPYLSFCDDNCIGAFGNCQITHMNVSPDFYCGHGEKKDKE